MRIHLITLLALVGLVCACNNTEQNPIENKPTEDVTNKKPNNKENENPDNTVTQCRKYSTSRPNSACTEETFYEVTTTNKLGDFAFNFSFPYEGGNFSMSDNWNACDNYFFFNYNKGNKESKIVFEGLTKSQVKTFFKSVDRNTYLFFGTLSDVALLAPIKQAVTDALAELSAEDKAHWQDRIRFATKSYEEIGGPLKNVMQKEAGLGFIIHRDQRLSSLGYPLIFQPPKSFTYRFDLLAYDANYANYLFDLDRRLVLEQDVTEIVFLDEIREKNSDNPYEFEVDLGDAKAWKEANHLEFVLETQCGELNTGSCGEWDYSGHFFLCADDACSKQDEFLRWITPYARPGRKKWVVDATALMPLFQQGGKRKVRLQMLWYINQNHYRLTARLKTVKGDPFPIKTERLFEGGDWYSDYNSKHPPISVSIPKEATSAQFYALITGHGHHPANNCAEWCDHHHDFKIGGSPAVSVSYPNGQPFGIQQGGLGCAKLAYLGVVPNQGGNWAPGRAAWCPGLIVSPIIEDVTTLMAGDGPKEWTYRSTYKGKDPLDKTKPDDAIYIKMASYLTSYKAVDDWCK